MTDYMNPNFDIMEYIGRDSVDNLKNISDYLNFAIKSTILKQMPNISKEEEQKMAEKVLKLYLVNTNFAFTRKDNIRANMEQIGKKRLFDLIMKSALEKKAFNIRVRHLLADQTYQDQCVTWITNQINAGSYDSIISLLQSNPDMLNSLIENYIDLSYNVAEETKSNYNDIAWSEPLTEKALNNLNVSICMDSFKKSM